MVRLALTRKGRRKAKRDIPVQDPTLQDIVIPVMGPTGAGKSTFINKLLGENLMEVGHGLTSCTAQLQYGVIDLATVPYYKRFGLGGHRLIIVDTPGFDDTYEGDVEILRRIAVWLEKSYRDQMVLAGVIYLHDVSQTRFSGTARRNLEMFHHLCGEAALSKVVLGTTKWGRVDLKECRSHEAELRGTHWKGMIDKGSHVRRFEGAQKSAREFIDVILGRKALEGFLQIQEELVVEQKIIAETKAAKQLRNALQQALDMQQKMTSFEAAMATGGDPEAEAKLEEMRQKISCLTREIEELKVPFARRFFKMLGIPYT